MFLGIYFRHDEPLTTPLTCHVCLYPEMLPKAENISPFGFDEDIYFCIVEMFGCLLVSKGRGLSLSRASQATVKVSR